MSTPHTDRLHAHRTAARRTLAFVTAACLASATLLVASAIPAAHAVDPAATTLPGTILHGGFTNPNHTTTVFAYVKAGETFSAQLGEYPGMTSRMTVTVTNPRGEVVDASAAGGPVDVDTNIVADIDGVWSVTVQDPADILVNRPPYPGVTWNIAAEKDGQPVPGRVFSESFAFNTPATTTLSLFALTKSGALYRETLRDYNGIDSTIQVTNKGNVLVDDPVCDPTYKSVPMPHSAGADGSGLAFEQPVSATDCPGLERYRLFLDTPAADLPLTETNWADGRTTETWVGATYTAPSISNLSYTRSGTAGNAGTLTGTLDTQPGTVSVDVDVDGDGIFDGEKDVVLTQIVPAPGPFEIAWDGRDASGALVEPTVSSAFRATLDRTNEAHFLRTDVEVSRGGIEILRLTGGATNPTAVHFDDSRFADTSASRYSATTPLTSGPDGIDSTGGVHRWTGDDSGAGRTPNANTGTAGSWGDVRSIDDWTFGADGAVASTTIEPLTPHLTIEKHGTSSATPLVAGSTIDYTVGLTNDGTGDFSEQNPALATDYLDQGVTDKATLDEASIATSSGSARIDESGRLQWNAGALAAGTSATLTFTVTVLPNDDPAREDIVNTACVASAAHQPSQSEYGTATNPCATVPFDPPTPVTPPAPATPPASPPATPPALAQTPPQAPGLAATGATEPFVLAGMAAGTVLIGAALVAALAAKRRRAEASAMQEE